MNFYASAKWIPFVEFWIADPICHRWQRGRVRSTEVEDIRQAGGQEYPSDLYWMSGVGVEAVTRVLLQSSSFFRLAGRRRQRHYSERPQNPVLFLKAVWFQCFECFSMFVITVAAQQHLRVWYLIVVQVG